MPLVIVVVFVMYVIVLAILGFVRARPPEPIPPFTPSKFQQRINDIPRQINEFHRRQAQVLDRWREAVRRNFSQPLPPIHHGPPDAWGAALARHHVLYVPASAPLMSPAPTDAVSWASPPQRPTFKPDEPTTLTEYVGQQAIVTQLSLHIKALAPTAPLLSHRLLTGLPGFGKTLLAKVIANELADRADHAQLPPVSFLETYAANLNSVRALDDTVRVIAQNAATVWFIDEIHVLNTELATKIYLLMEEGRYPFTGSVNPTPLPPVMVLGATTDYGQLHPALKRRFGEALMMRPMTRWELTIMATFALPPDTDGEAIEQIVTRCVASGAPHEVKTLTQEVARYARGHALPRITAETTAAVFTLLGIDAQGLREVDRLVLHTLYRRPKYRLKDGMLLGYGASEADICTMAGLDRTEFQQVIRPRLMSHGYLEIRPGVGLALTERAMHDYPQDAAWRA